jgi:hypothetical protein
MALERSGADTPAAEMRSMRPNSKSESTMHARITLLGLVLATISLVAVAQDASRNEKELNCIKDVTYSEAFLKKYPMAGAACRDVKIQNGEKWVRFVAKIAAVNGNQFTANFIDEFNNTVETVTFEGNAGDKFTVNGKEVDIATMMPGDTLDFWWPQSRLGFYAKAGSEKMKELRVVSVTPGEIPR